MSNKHLLLKKSFLSLILISNAFILIGQINNVELFDLDGTCPPSGWTSVGITGCELIDIEDGWNHDGFDFNLPPSIVAPNAVAGDKVWSTFENSLGQFGGIAQNVGPLIIGESYCLEFNGAVNRIFSPTASLSVRLEVDNNIVDSHAFIYGNPLEPVSLCFTATAQNQNITLRTQLNSGLTTFLLIEEGSGSLVSNSSCPETFTVIGNPILTGIYKARKSINSAGTIANAGDVVFTGGREIELNPGFLVPQSAIFTAMIQGCQ